MKKKIHNLFDENRMIISDDPGDYMSQPFCIELERLYEKHGKTVLDEILENVMNGKNSLDSIEHAVNFCCLSNSIKQNEKIEMLEHVMRNHQNSSIRKIAAMLLHDIECDDIIYNAYSSENDNDVKFAMEKYCLAGNRIRGAFTNYGDKTYPVSPLVNELYEMEYSGNDDLREKTINDMVDKFGFAKTGRILGTMVKSHTRPSVFGNVAKLVSVINNNEIKSNFNDVVKYGR